MVPEAPPTDLRRLKADGRPFKKGDVREDGYKKSSMVFDMAY